MMRNIGGKPCRWIMGQIITESAMTGEATVGPMGGTLSGIKRLGIFFHAFAIIAVS